MAKHHEGLKNGPIDCMLKEHDTMRGLKQEAINSLIKNQDTGIAKYKITCIESLREFIFTLRNHIDKEDTILYMMAEDLIKELKNGDEVMMSKFNDIQVKQQRILEKFNLLISA